MFSLEDVQGQGTLHSKYLEKKYNMEKLKENCRNQAEQRVLSDKATWERKSACFSC